MQLSIEAQAFEQQKAERNLDTCEAYVAWLSTVYDKPLTLAIERRIDAHWARGGSHPHGINAVGV